MRRVLALSLLASAVLAQDGPWKNDLSLWESRDGLKFQRVGVFVERGGVPSLVSDGKGRLVSVFQWFPFDREEDFDRVGVRISEDGGENWSDPEPIRVKGLPESYERPYDPTLVPLADGRLRVYFTSRDMEGDNEQATYSAMSEDGVTYEFEPGKRFGVRGERVIDCAVCLHEGSFYYYSPVQEHDGKGYHAVSKDGLTFDRQDDVSVAGRRPWLGCVVSTPAGLRFYGTGEGGWTATSKDGATWKLNERTRTDGCDPGVAQTEDGRWLMVSTGPRNPNNEEPPFDPRPKGGAPIEEGPPGRPASIGSDGKRLYVVRGEWIYELDPVTLKVLRKVKVK